MSRGMKAKVHIMVPEASVIWVVTLPEGLSALLAPSFRLHWPPCYSSIPQALKYISVSHLLTFGCLPQDLSQPTIWKAKERYLPHICLWMASSCLYNAFKTLRHHLVQGPSLTTWKPEDHSPPLYVLFIMLCFFH